MGFYNSHPFQIIQDLTNIPFGVDNVYVVSDSQYKKLKSEQAASEIAVLEKRLDSYVKAAESLRETITSIQKEYDLLPPESTNEN